MDMEKCRYIIILVIVGILVSECHALGKESGGRENEERRRNEGGGEKEKLMEFEEVWQRLQEMERANLKGFHLPGGKSYSIETGTLTNFLKYAQLYLPSPSMVNPTCQRDLMAIYLAMVDLKDPSNNWVVYLVDSWGKFPDGILAGNFKPVGFFHECLNIHVKQSQNTSTDLNKSDNPLINFEKYIFNDQGKENGNVILENGFFDEDYESSGEEIDFEGQYCLLSYKTNNTQIMAELDDGLRMPIISASSPASRPLLTNMAYGTCIPSSCTPSELQNSIDDALKDEGLEVAQVWCQTAKTSPTLHTPEIVGIVLVSVLSFILVLATLVDIITSHHWQHYRTGAFKYLLTFSVSANMNKLFHLQTTPSPGVISPIYGVRFLSICWVVLGHQFAFSIQLSQNLLELPKMTQPVLFQLISNADKSVDTFFLLSGLLATLGTLTLVTKRGKFNPTYYYIHRVVRLLPPLALTVGLVACLSYIVTPPGPFLPIMESQQLRWCRHNWWIDLTFMGNLFMPHMDSWGPEYGGGLTCLPHTWYVDVDMQLFIVLPLFILPLYYRPKIGWVWLGFVTMVSFMIPGIIIGVNNLWPTNMIIIADQSAGLDYTQKVYMMPWCRAGAYLVGAWIGYLLYIAKSNPHITRLKQWQVWIGWGISTGTALAVLLGIAEYNQINLTETVPTMSLGEAVVYGAFHRAAWALAVGWVLVACHWGYGGPVNWILSHPIWQPLSRLTYTIYLTSLPIQTITFFSTQRLIYYTVYQKIQEMCGVLLVIIAASIWVTLVSESPVLAIEKLLLPQRAEPSPSYRVNSDDRENTLISEEVTPNVDDHVTKEERTNSGQEGEVNHTYTNSEELYRGTINENV